MTLREPLFLLLFLILPVLIWHLFLRRRDPHSALVWSDIYRVPYELVRRAQWRLNLVRVFALLAWVFLLIALLGPQREYSYEQRFSEGIDIMIVLDVSGSMLSIDDKNAFLIAQQHGYYHDPERKLINRLQYARRLTEEFVMKRRDDRLGLVIFAGYALMKCPLTFDHDMLRSILKDVDVSDIEQQSTAIGMAIACGLQGLVSSKNKSRILILVTDGANNTGTIGPETASEMARTLGIRIYCVGVGSLEPLVPARRSGYYVRGEADVDEAALRDIARKTGAEYFYASDEKELEAIYDRIDVLEKSTIERRVFAEREEKYQRFLWLALGSLLLSLILRHIVFRIMPGEAI